MRRYKIVGAAIAFTVGILAPAVAAVAMPVGPGADGNGAATPFKANYTYASVAFTCSGAHVVNRVSVKDSETCLLSGAGIVAGTYTGAPYGFQPPFGTQAWVSDFNGVTAKSWTITVADNGDGTFTENVVAYY